MLLAIQDQPAVSRAGELGRALRESDPETRTLLLGKAIEPWLKALGWLVAPR